MEKYFKERKEFHLSTYLKRGNLSEELERTTKYLMYCLGDVAMPLDIIETYDLYFSCFGGRYDVRHELETVKGLYEFYRKFPHITSEAFYEVAHRYIKDLFDVYSLEQVFKKMIEVYGETDEIFEKFIQYVELKAKKLEKKYDKAARKLDVYTKLYHIDGYEDGYIPFLKSLILGKHIAVDKVIESMPGHELVVNDSKQLYSLAEKYRCYMGCGYPISYLMTRSLIKGEDLEEIYGKEPAYFITQSIIEPATFTTQEFIKSVEEHKVKKL